MMDRKLRTECYHLCVPLNAWEQEIQSLIPDPRSFWVSYDSCPHFLEPALPGFWVLAVSTYRE